MISRILFTTAALSLALTFSSCSTRGGGMIGRKDWSYHAAQAEADKDVASGKIKIYWGGTRSVEPLVPPDSRQLALTLPRKDLPSGTSDPVVHQAMGYGQAYNWEVLSYLGQNGRAAPGSLVTSTISESGQMSRPSASARPTPAPAPRIAKAKPTPKPAIAKVKPTPKPAVAKVKSTPAPTQVVKAKATPAPRKPLFRKTKPVAYSPPARTAPTPGPTPKKYDPYQTQYLDW